VKCTAALGSPAVARRPKSTIEDTRAIHTGNAGYGRRCYATTVFLIMGKPSKHRDLDGIALIQ
jgi:hypothetical protein